MNGVRVVKELVTLLAKKGVADSYRPKCQVSTVIVKNGFRFLWYMVQVDRVEIFIQLFDIETEAKHA